MNSIDIKMKSVEVKSSVRPLRAKWTSEMVQDLKLHGYDFEREYNKLLKIEKRRKSIKNIFPIQKP